MLNEYDVVKLRVAKPEHGLAAGALGAILVVHKATKPAYEVEFCDSNGRTIVLLTLADADLVFVQPG